MYGGFKIRFLFKLKKTAMLTHCGFFLALCLGEKDGFNPILSYLRVLFIITLLIQVIVARVTIGKSFAKSCLIFPQMDFALGAFEGGSSVCGS